MSFICTDCSTAGTLKILRQIEIPPDSRSDEITLQIIKCSRCGFEGIAVYEESRRGAFGDESVDHYGYYLSEADVQELKKLIDACPNPDNFRCSCEVHQRLGKKNENSRWDGLAEFKVDHPFVLRFR